MPAILLTGIATLDIINTLDHYPAENTEVRVQKQHMQCGGNACNSAVVLKQLGVSTHLLSNRAADNHASEIFSFLQQQGIHTDLCPVQLSGSTPVSHIILNTKNASRTICHYRDLAELAAADFIKLDFSAFDWLHFEARNCIELKKMLHHVQPLNIPVSIELEKPRDSIAEIMPYAQLLLISRPFAESQGFHSATDCLQHFAKKFPDKMITCTWGEQGAWAYTRSSIIHQPAATITNPVETLGAGDTFNAGIIASLLKQHSLPHALCFASQLAANKCRQNGFEQLIIPDK